MDSNLPSAVEAEKVMLGCILLDPRLFWEANEALRVSDFFLDSHRRIYRSMEGLAISKRAIDIVTLCEEIDRRKEIGSIGGRPYLFSLTEGLPRKASISEYVRIIKDKSLGRQIIGACTRTIARASDQSEDQALVLSECIRGLEDALLDSPDVADMQSVGQYAIEEDPFAHREEGLKTGFLYYDSMSGGLHAEELTLVAARTSVGKTSFAGSLAMNLTQAGKPVAVFLNEQSKRSFFFRLVSRKANVPLSHIVQNKITATDKFYIDDAVAQIKMLPMFLESNSHTTVPEIRAKCQRLIRGGEDLACIIIDQLNHLPSEGVVRKEERLRPDEVIGKIVLAVKDIAKDLHMPVILCHQLNREAAKKEARPTLETLKGSGSCEEHADNVLLLYRPGEEAADAELIVAKARDGPTGVCAMSFVKECCSWGNRA